MSKLPPDYAGRPLPKRFQLLDLSRGLAAMVVLLLHWPHFFTGVERPPYEVFPAYGLLEVFYRNSIWAVDFFFCLSGFVFFLHYQERLANRTVSARRYARLRIARLYPLYLAAIVLVVVLQLVYHRQNGAFAVYGHFDLWHLVLSLLGVSEWGLQQGLSFNGPDWSVSVEFFLYVMFFFACRMFGCARLRTVLAMVLLGLVLLLIYRPFGRGVTGFFMGGMVCLLYRAIRTTRPGRGLALLTGVTATAWVFALWPDLNEWLYAGLTDLGRRVMPDAVDRYVAGAVRYAMVLVLLLGLFPATLLLLALAEPWLGPKVMRLTFLGDSSYAIYILHFPLQILVLLIVDASGVERDIFLQVWTVPAFLLLTVAVGCVSYHCFERPMQRWLRFVGSADGRKTDGLPSKGSHD